MSIIALMIFIFSCCFLLIGAMLGGIGWGVYTAGKTTEENTRVTNCTCDSYSVLPTSTCPFDCDSDEFVRPDCHYYNLEIFYTNTRQDLVKVTYRGSNSCTRRESELAAIREMNRINNATLPVGSTTPSNRCWYDVRTPRAVRFLNPVSSYQGSYGLGIAGFAILGAGALFIVPSGFFAFCNPCSRRRRW